jgi:hypothetical protein
VQIQGEAVHIHCRAGFDGFVRQQVLIVIRDDWHTNSSGISLERIQQYIDIEQEKKPAEAGKPPAHWPSSGELIVEKLSARYSPDGPQVLRDISFRINSGERVGIGESYLHISPASLTLSSKKLVGQVLARYSIISSLLFELLIVCLEFSNTRTSALYIYRGDRTLRRPPDGHSQSGRFTLQYHYHPADGKSAVLEAFPHVDVAFSPSCCPGRCGATWIPSSSTTTRV